MIQKIIEGLQIFAKYDFDVSAEHDVIYASENTIHNEQISEDDKQKLRELDWGFSAEDEHWYYFV